MDVKVIVFRVRVYLVIPPHCRDTPVWHHPVSPEAEAAPKAAASLQRGQLKDRTWAQLQQQEDSSEGGDDGHTAEHSNGDGKLRGRRDL